MNNPTATDLDPYVFLSRLRKQSNPPDCGKVFRQAIAPLGFDTFACGEIDRRNRGTNTFYIIDWPPDWLSFYSASGLIERDPLIDALETHTEPFTWSELRAERKFSKLGRHAIDLAAAAGWLEGMVIPLPQGSNRIGLVSMVGRVPCTDPAARAYLTLISVCLHSHVRSLVSRSGFAIAPAGLTDREIACLRLAAQGLTDRSIGEQLGIAASTAHEFIEKAKRRFNTRSRTELVAIAVALGIIDI